MKGLIVIGAGLAGLSAVIEAAGKGTKSILVFLTPLLFLPWGRTEAAFCRR